MDRHVYDQNLFRFNLNPLIPCLIRVGSQVVSRTPVQETPIMRSMNHHDRKATFYFFSKYTLCELICDVIISLVSYGYGKDNKLGWVLD